MKFNQSNQNINKHSFWYTTSVFQTKSAAYTISIFHILSFSELITWSSVLGMASITQTEIVQHASDLRGLLISYEKANRQISALGKSTFQKNF